MNRLAYRAACPAFLQRALLRGVLVALCPPQALFAKLTWDPVPAEDRQATECRAYPGASAEALFLRLVLVGSGSNDHAEYYKRIKIYRAKAADDIGVLGIDYGEAEQIWEYAARVVKPDGSAKQYGRESFHEATTARLGRKKRQRLVLVLPDLAAGDIVELKWSSSINSESDSYYWWYAQMEIPVRLYSLRTDNLARDFTAMGFNLASLRDRKPNDTRAIDLEMTNLPPYEEEPNMPPERDVRGWFMVLFRDKALRGYKGGDLLKMVGASKDEEFRSRTKPDATIKARSAALLAGAGDDDEKLRRL